MSKFYRPLRTRNKYDPQSDKPFKLSRSKIDLFLNCPACFYLDRRIGVNLPPGYPFNLNSAVDNLLKDEFDVYRRKRIPHPLCVENSVEAIPFEHHDLDKWRDALRGGVEFFDRERNLVITGGIDDVWINKDGHLNVVDYKATSKKGEVSLDADWQIGYKRQIEVYQWLLRRNEFDVSDIGYFVYCNGDSQKGRFDAVMDFDIKLIPYCGNDSWIEGTLDDIIDCLRSDEVPKPSEECDFCAYFEVRNSKQAVLA